MDEMIEQVNPTHVTLDDLEELINSLSPEEVEELAECDPDDSSMPPSMRCVYRCNKQATGEMDRDHLINGLKDIALSIPDKEEKVKFELGIKRGKVFVPNPEDAVKKEDSGESSDEDEDEIRTRMQDQEKAAAAREFIEALDRADENDIHDFAEILGLTFQNNSSIRSLNLESNSVSGERVLDIIKATANTKGLEELKVAHQFNNKYLGASIEYALAEMIPKFPHLVKLGVALEFRDTLNKIAVALTKNLDKRRQNEDRTFTLKLDKSGKTGPKIVQEK